MSWDTLIDIVIALFSGKSEFASAALTNPSVLLVLFSGTLLSIAIITAKNQHYMLTLLSLGCAAGLAFTFYVQQSAAFDLHAGRVFIGGDIEAAAAGARNVSLDACQQICLSDSRCAAFTYDQKTKLCYPKSDITTMHVFGPAISGIRRSRHGNFTSSSR